MSGIIMVHGREVHEVQGGTHFEEPWESEEHAEMEAGYSVEEIQRKETQNIQLHLNKTKCIVTPLHTSHCHPFTLFILSHPSHPSRQ